MVEPLIKPDKVTMVWMAGTNINYKVTEGG